MYFVNQARVGTGEEICNKSLTESNLRSICQNIDVFSHNPIRVKAYSFEGLMANPTCLRRLKTPTLPFPGASRR